MDEAVASARRVGSLAVEVASARRSGEHSRDKPESPIVRSMATDLCSGPESSGLLSEQLCSVLVVRCTKSAMRPSAGISECLRWHAELVEFCELQSLQRCERDS